jgi:hypothetical protein
MIPTPRMTKDEALRRLAQLAAKKTVGLGQDRPRFTAWALEAESFFVSVLDPKNPALVAYRELVADYINKGGDWLRKVHNVSGAFQACQAIVENATPEEIEARHVASPGDVSTDPPGEAGGKIRLFISHSSVDASLAGLLVSLFRSAMNLAPNDIRCTSVDGSRLPGGADTDEEIRKELHHAEVVVGIISYASLESLYVAFELGARWGLGKSLIPVMAPGVSPSTIKGPLSGKNALRADSAGQLQQLVSEVAGNLALVPYSPASYQSALDAVSLRANIRETADPREFSV